uniref:Uncharacterized protein n=1 Tax=Parascaris univalens TaxID=6257 RepID=A0A914ZHX1_PARUN
MRYRTLTLTRSVLGNPPMSCLLYCHIHVHPSPSNPTSVPNISNYCADIFDCGKIHQTHKPKLTWNCGPDFRLQ